VPTVASPVKLYQREMHERLGFFANWLPADPIDVGDVGRLEAGRFRRTSSLAEFGIETTAESGGGDQPVEYTSSNGTQVELGGGAGAAGLAKAEVRVSFSRTSAFVFHASKLRLLRLSNPAAVARDVVVAYDEGRWEKDWLIVESLHEAEIATILVSQDSASELVLSADVSELLASFSLADPNIDFSVTSSRGQVVKIIQAEGVHPLYSCMRVRDPLIGAPSLRPVRGSRASAHAAFARPRLDELLNS
jgi:hypothetical protein